MLNFSLFAASQWIIWLVLFVVFLVAEAATVGLTTIWFAGGALAALLTSLVTDNIIVQLVVFLIISFLLLYTVRPFALKYMKPRKTETNYKGAIGQSGRVIEEINNKLETGRIVVNGQEWMARTVNPDETIAVDEMVNVEEITGVKAMVTKA